MPGHNYITWTTTGSIDYVRIRLYDGNSFLEEIDSYTYNDGFYDWYLSSYDIYDGSNYRIEISDYDDTFVYAFSNYFTINIPEDSGDGGDPSIPGYSILIFVIISIFTAGFILRRIKK